MRAYGGGVNGQRVAHVYRGAGRSLHAARRAEFRARHLELRLADAALGLHDAACKHMVLE